MSYENEERVRIANGYTSEENGEAKVGVTGQSPALQTTLSLEACLQAEPNLLVCRRAKRGELTRDEVPEGLAPNLQQHNLRAELAKRGKDRSEAT